ncbi:MAG TPA: helix-turn-helix domain-containing protein, partial [Oleiagrimonas sp.]|nr:helix-turn-helix domain-containing protein [Oleiagrimonas sp.]
MHSTQDDRTSRAIIRDETLRLFAAHGADAVTVRQIAAAAHVSPALVVRHYGSKDGLREAVDTHVLQTLADMLIDITQRHGTPGVATSLADALLQSLPPDSPIPRYLARLFVEGGEAARTMFR